MRVARARTIWSLSCRHALTLIAGVVLAGPAWADSDQARTMSVVVPPIVAESSSQPARAVTVSSHAVTTPASAELPQGANGGDDRRVLMMMMMGQVLSGGAFGRLGQ